MTGTAAFVNVWRVKAKWCSPRKVGPKALQQSCSNTVLNKAWRGIPHTLEHNKLPVCPQTAWTWLQVHTWTVGTV